MWYCADFALDNRFYQLSIDVADYWSMFTGKMNQEDQGAIYQTWAFLLLRKKFFLLKLLVFLIGGVQNKNI
jgi:hypothetical protein